MLPITPTFVNAVIAKEPAIPEFSYHGGAKGAEMDYGRRPSMAAVLFTLLASGLFVAILAGRLANHSTAATR